MIKSVFMSIAVLSVNVFGAARDRFYPTTTLTKYVGPALAPCEDRKILYPHPTGTPEGSPSLKGGGAELFPEVRPSKTTNGVATTVPRRLRAFRDGTARSVLDRGTKSSVEPSAFLSATFGII
jgi:hypothetical protein